MRAATFSGKPCSKGHDGTRYVSTRACVQCALERDQRRPSRPYVRKADRAPGFRTIRAADLQGQASPPMTLARDDGAPLQLEHTTPHDLGEALAQALAQHGLAHVALTHLDGPGLWQCVTLRPGYKDQVTRTGRTAGEALASALGAQRGRMDELLDVVG